MHQKEDTTNLEPIEVDKSVNSKFRMSRRLQRVLKQNLATKEDNLSKESHRVTNDAL